MHCKKWQKSQVSSNRNRNPAPPHSAGWQSGQRAQNGDVNVDYDVDVAACQRSHRSKLGVQCTKPKHYKDKD